MWLDYKCYNEQTRSVCGYDKMNKYSKDNVVAKALTLIGKLQHKYGFKPKFYTIVEFTPEKESLPTIVEEESATEVRIFLQSKSQ